FWDWRKRRALIPNLRCIKSIWPSAAWKRTGVSRNDSIPQLDCGRTGARWQNRGSARDGRKGPARESRGRQREDGGDQDTRRNQAETASNRGSGGGLPRLDRTRAEARSKSMGAAVRNKPSASHRREWRSLSRPWSSRSRL